MTVNVSNNPPSAQDDTFQRPSNSDLVVTFANVLANDGVLAVEKSPQRNGIDRGLAIVGQGRRETTRLPADQPGLCHVSS